MCSHSRSPIIRRLCAPECTHHALQGVRVVRPLECTRIQKEGSYSARKGKQGCNSCANCANLIQFQVVVPSCAKTIKFAEIAPKRPGSLKNILRCTNFSEKCRPRRLPAVCAIREGTKTPTIVSKVYLKYDPIR